MIGKLGSNTMVKTLFKSLLLQRRQSGDRGFTLTELLIVTLLAGGIVSGLMFLVVELLSTDQRESARSETQRDMQRALDYISAELREAVYVYPSECFAGQGTPGSATSNPSDNYCPGLNRVVPPIAGNNTTPVLAFWKQQRLPDVLLTQCARNPRTTTNIPCLSGHSYALVVYSLSTADPNNIWEGNARIVRYALNEFRQNGSATPGYAVPLQQESTFQTWPFTKQGQDLRNGVPGGAPDPLTDFVDDGRGAAADGTAGAAVCPTGYSTSPLAANAPNSFYACISPPTSGSNQEVVLFLRGNAAGRSGVNTQDTFLTTLSTRVFTRGVLRKNN